MILHPASNEGVNNFLLEWILAAHWGKNPMQIAKWAYV